ncbi:S41 family peptidase [Robiginitalea marina]|uniref:Tricorn protease homolog n=1 Tax=Robiginitalea marina TaxID=2954105 RepID=A0ABT1B0K5_9FLAO|nr:S41 family peptidase [Robiginitalea marina]MCO5725823.1 S41 family peptidase [Robiginitalea marina]
MRFFPSRLAGWLLAPLLFLSVSNAFSQGFKGYYRYPALHKQQIVFTAEGDLWTVPLSGGLARRLTSHPEEETHPAFSPDGTTIAFTASYEGPAEVYTMPAAGGLPTRWTYEREASMVNGWTPDGRVAYQTRAYSRVPDFQVVTLSPETGAREAIPLSQASEASFDAAGETVYFVRPAYHRNVTKRYKGGTARQIWKFSQGSPEAVRLTREYTGESHHPMWYQGRVYFISDRDGTMNLWSMDEDGNDLRQHTVHIDFDVRTATLSEGNIVYQWGADLWAYNIASDAYNKVEISLTSDLDQLREKWEENPARYITHVSPDPKGEKIAITSRGRVFVAPAGSGRFVDFTGKSQVRYRDAVFSHDGKDLLVLSDESGEFEFVRLPANGIGPEKAITRDGEILRFEGVPSPDGRGLAYKDLLERMYILDLNTGISTQVSSADNYVGNPAWSPDGQWLAFEETADNLMTRIVLYHLPGKKAHYLTTDRANSVSPQWSRDGKFIYFLSDRSFTSLVGSPWGPRQPEPYFDAKFKLYHVPLQAGTRSPFQPGDELNPEPEKEAKDGKAETPPTVRIDLEGLAQRLLEVPVPAGNYSNLSLGASTLYLQQEGTGLDAKTDLMAVKMANEDVKLLPIAKDIRSYTLTADGEKLLLRKGSNFYMVEAGDSEVEDLDKAQISLKGWKFPITPRDEWRQLYTDAWRMERDYFYDKNMHGVDWDAMHAKYLPLVDRVTTREELSDLIGRFVGELSALHTSVRGGDVRSDEKNIEVASLGAVFSRDEAGGGFRIDRIYRADPDYPEEKSPLDQPGLNLKEGDVITSVNGKPSLEARDMGELIRNQEGRQVRLRVKQPEGVRDLIVVPLGNDYNLRYRDWEYANRLQVEAATENQVGYLHLRAMGSDDISQFYREFYPVFDRQGLIIDVRYNFGGNIDSFILEKLLRKAWMYWATRSGKPTWNMQYAFRGHMVVLVNENTYSDGEAFADGFKKLGMGTTIGTRTWGGEIWLSSANRLSDGGLARAPMMGVYGENGQWLIEGHGFEPDIVVDNLPHATFNGKDAQLERAIKVLQEQIRKDPRPVPPPPPFPDKSFGNNKKQ